MATGKASRNRTIGIAFAFGLVRLLPAVSTTFTGTGLWTDVTKWNNGVPQAGDTAIIDNNGSVTLDGITVNAWCIMPCARRFGQLQCHDDGHGFEHHAI